jgi:hypothetical protein
MGVKGIDKTGAAFTSIRNRAKATGASIRSIMGGAIAAAGAYLSLRSIKSGIDELGKLSDMAMKSGTSVEFLTKATTAFQVAGLDVSAESLVKAMQLMQKNTGKQGEGAFFDIAKQIAAIPDASDRAKAAVQVFGRSGMELLPLVNNGQEAINKFRDLAYLMPHVSSTAADAGDAAADALTIFGKGAQVIGLKVVGKLCELFGQDFPGGVRAGALNAINALEAFAKRTKAIFVSVGKNIGASMNWWADLFTQGKDFADSQFAKNVNASEKEFVDTMMAIDKQREEYKAVLKTKSVDDLANAFGGRRELEISGESFGAAAAKRISNTLMLGGSSSAQRLALLGPEYQNESKKQTSLLKEIAANTKKAADSEGDTLTVTDLGT